MIYTLHFDCITCSHTQVDGISVVGCTNHQAVEMLRNTGTTVTIKLERYLRGPKYEQLQQAIRANELKIPSSCSPTMSSLPKVPLSKVVNIHNSYNIHKL